MYWLGGSLVRLSTCVCVWQRVVTAESPLAPTAWHQTEQSTVSTLCWLRCAPYIRRNAYNLALTSSLLRRLSIWRYPHLLLSAGAPAAWCLRLLMDICCRSQHTHTHTFNGPFSGTIQVGRYLKGKTNLDFTEARDSEWQWHQLGHMQVCTLLQTGNHTSTPPLSFLQAGCPSCCPTNSVKALKASQHSAANPLATVAADDRRDRQTDGRRTVT